MIILILVIHPVSLSLCAMLNHSYKLRRSLLYNQSHTRTSHNQLHTMLSHLTFPILLGILVAANGQWKKADLTNYVSYPDCCSDPNADQTECEDFSGCKYQGTFAYVDGKKSKEWVKKNNIIAIHNKYKSQYKLKTLELRSGGKTIKAKVYDECNDKDCNGCCTKNSKKTGFLIDVEKFTMQRFGKGDGVIEWRCVDC